MSAPAPARSVSWLDLDAPEVSEATAAILDRTRAALGYVRNQQHVLTHKPAILAAVGALGDAVVRDQDGVLTPRERELMALVVSAENRCEACVFAHGAALRGLGADAEWVDTIVVNYRRASLTARERALSDFALAITRAPAETGPEALDVLRAAGLSETGLIEAASVAAYFNFTNRLNNALGIQANSPAWHAAR